MAMWLQWLTILSAALISPRLCVPEIDCFKGENSCSGNDVHRIRLLNDVICCPTTMHFRITRDCRCVEGSLTVSNSDFISSLLGPGQVVGSRFIGRVRVQSSRVPGHSTDVTITQHAESGPGMDWSRTASSGWHTAAHGTLGWPHTPLRPNTTSLFHFLRPFNPLLNLDPDLTLAGVRGGGVRVNVTPQQTPPPETLSRQPQQDPLTGRRPIEP